MSTLETIGINELNRYILEETDFVDQALRELDGLYSEDWEEYDVAAPVRQIDNRDMEILHSLEFGEMSIAELRDEVYFEGEDLEFLEESYFIRKNEQIIPEISSRVLTNLYLEKVDEVMKEV